jgi:hypothetical protein
MRRRKRAFQASWRVAFLLALLSSATARCADREKSSASAMPSMLPGVRLGMSEEELRRLRPAAERFEIFGEPEVQGDPNPLYTEKLARSSFFDTVSYAFCDRRLCNVTFAAAGRGEPFAVREGRILHGAMRKWGDDPERLLSVGDRIAGVEVPRYKYPALLWRLDGVRVLLTFSPFPAAETGPGQTAPRQPPAISLSIFEPARLREDLRQGLFKSLVPVPPADDARLFALLDQQVEPPLFE